MMSAVQDLRIETLPPLNAGQRLDQPTFHARYAAMPPETRAELVGGVVYMPSPLSGDHGEIDADLCGWLFLYRSSTAGLRGGSGVTTKLGAYGEPQPDQQLRIPESVG